MKAGTFTAYVEAAKQTYPTGDFDLVLSSLPAETQAVIRTPPVSVAWLDGQHYFRFTDAVLTRLLSGEPRKLRAVAKRQLTNDLRGIYKLFVRLSSPDFIISRAASVYGTYWRDHGTIRATKGAPHSVDVFYEGFDGTPAYYWELQAGAIEGALEASGCKGVNVDVKAVQLHGATLQASWYGV